MNNSPSPQSEKISLALLAHLFQQLPDGFLLVDQEQSVVFANDAAATHFVKQAILPDLSEDRVSLGSYAPRAAVRSFIEFAQRPAPGAMDRFTLEDGREFEVSYLIINTECGTLYGSLIRDLSAVCLPDQELREVHRKLKELDRQRSEFLGIAAHDLRSPLHKIGLSAELLAEGNLDEAGKKRFLDIILRSSNTMVHLLNDLLSITKIESGRLDLKPQSVVLHDFLETILEESRELALKRGIQLSLTVADRSARVSLDPVRMEQVMTNLLSNAFKFSQRNTAVSVRANSDTGEAVIEVEDQGIGITPEDQKRLFTAFQESSNRPLHGEESTGLGLAICKKIVELHRGSIEVESTVGKGSLFRVRLPYDEVN